MSFSDIVNALNIWDELTEEEKKAVDEAIDRNYGHHVPEYEEDGMCA